jgi:hypothetical protein
MKKLFCLIMCFLLTGCTITLMLTDSHGTDNDVDSSPTTEASTDIEASIPAIGR